LYDGISMSVRTSYDYEKKENSNLSSEYDANVVLIIGIWCISHTHKRIKNKKNTHNYNCDTTEWYWVKIQWEQQTIFFKENSEM
jgi:hypothetical protein